MNAKRTLHLRIVRNKTILTLVLLIGISLVLPSCGKTINEYAVKGEFHYINKTSGPVEITMKGPMSGANFANYVISAGDSLALVTDGDTHETTANPKGYVPPLLADSTTIFFGDSLCYYEIRDEKRVLNNIDAYEYQRLSERSYLFRLVLDSVLVNQAVDCN